MDLAIGPFFLNHFTGTTGKYMLSNIKSYLAAKQVAAAQSKAKVEQERSIEAKAQTYAQDELLTPGVKEVLESEYYLALKTDQENKRVLDAVEAAHKAALVNQQALTKLETDLDAIYAGVVTNQDKAETLRSEAKEIKQQINEKAQAIKAMGVNDRLAAARAKAVKGKASV